MVKPFKPTRPTKLPENAQIVLRDGRRHVKFVERGKVVYYRLTKDGTRYLRPTKVWYFDIRDENGVVRRIRGSADRAVTERMIVDWHRRIERKRLGYYDPAEEHLRRPLDEHLNDYATFLQAKGDSEKHVFETVSRVRAALRGCGFATLADVNTTSITAWLLERRRDRKPVELPPGIETFRPDQAARVLGITKSALHAVVTRLGLPASGRGRARRLPRSTVEAVAENQAKGVSPATINHYVRALRGFFRWLVRSKRIGSNPVETLTLVPTTTDVRRRRRELSEDELRRLLAATRRSTTTFRGLTGEDRYFLYLIAVSTGLRARALANLRPEDFDLDSPSPVVTVPAKFQKNRRTHTVPLAADVAAALRPYIALKRIGSPLWPGTWATSNKAASMLRADLRAAGVPYAVEALEGPEYADFHSLRHTFLTTLGRCGVDLRIAQELAGHSTPLLTARYTHVRLHDLAGAVAKLPSLTTEGEVSQIAQIALRPTGTAGSDDASKAGTESAQVRFRFGSKSK
jgi:integrase